MQQLRSYVSAETILGDLVLCNKISYKYVIPTHFFDNIIKDLIQKINLRLSERTPA